MINEPKTCRFLWSSFQFSATVAWPTKNCQSLALPYTHLNACIICGTVQLVQIMMMCNQSAYMLWKKANLQDKALGWAQHRRISGWGLLDGTSEDALDWLKLKGLAWLGHSWKVQADWYVGEAEKLSFHRTTAPSPPVAIHVGLPPAAWSSELAIMIVLAYLYYYTILLYRYSNILSALLGWNFFVFMVLIDKRDFISDSYLFSF